MIFCERRAFVSLGRYTSTCHGNNIQSLSFRDIKLVCIDSRDEWQVEIRISTTFNALQTTVGRGITSRCGQN